jgi:hypothetical protein
MAQRRARSLNPQALAQYRLRHPAPVMDYDVVRRLLDDFDPLRYLGRGSFRESADLLTRADELSC